MSRRWRVEVVALQLSDVRVFVQLARPVDGAASCLPSNTNIVKPGFHLSSVSLAAPTNTVCSQQKQQCNLSHHKSLPTDVEIKFLKDNVKQSRKKGKRQGWKIQEEQESNHIVNRRCRLFSCKV